MAIVTTLVAAIVAASTEVDTTVAATGAAAAEARVSIAVAVEITMQITLTKASQKLPSNRTEWATVCTAKKCTRYMQARLFRLSIAPHYVHR